jgi:hypothetical protein
MATRHFAAVLVTGFALAGIAPAPNGAVAADLYVQEGSGTCHTVFTGMPVPPYFTRRGCIDNVITVHRLPEHRHSRVVLQQRDVLIYYRVLEFAERPGGYLGRMETRHAASA